MENRLDFVIRLLLSYFFSARRGAARPGRAGLGVAWPGAAWRGEANFLLDKAHFLKYRNRCHIFLARRGRAGQGEARRGVAWLGEARLILIGGYDVRL